MQGSTNAIHGIIQALKARLDGTDTKLGNTSISEIGDGTVTGAVSTINSNLTANSLTSFIDISGYTSSSNYYTFPSDGYVYMNAGAHTGNDIIINMIAGDGTIRRNFAEAAQGFYALFVKKGMRAYFTLTGSDNICRFYPFN